MKLNHKSFVDFLMSILDGLHQHSILVYSLLSAITIAITVPISYRYVAEKDYGEWYLCIPEVVSYTVFAVLVVCVIFYTLTSRGNVSRTQNEDIFVGCAWVILVIPLFVIYLSLKCIAFIISYCRNHKRNNSHITLEECVSRLNELRKKSLITEEEYSKQLAKLLDNGE